MDQARSAPGSVELVRTRFTAELLPATPARYAQDLGPLQGRFAAMVVGDSSRSPPSPTTG